WGALVRAALTASDSVFTLARTRGTAGSFASRAAATSFTKTEPATTASATRAISAARSGVRTPKPTATGRPAARRTRATAGATSAATASFTPVTPATGT